jgi:ribose transport system permease protein
MIFRVAQAERHRSVVIGYLLTLALLAIVSVIRPGFGLGSIESMAGLAVQAAVVFLASTGQTFVLLSGGVDLSLPWVLTGAAVMMASIAHGQDANLPVAILIALALSVAVGSINGFCIGYLGLSPIIVTLAMNGILLGAVSGIDIASRGTSFGTAPAALQTVVRGSTLGVPNVVLFALIELIIGAVVLSRSGFGRRLYAVGSNREVAKYSGVNVARTTMLVYVLSAFLAGVAGVLLAGKLGVAFLGMGDSYLFLSVAAVVIGGTSILGGEGHLVGTMGGALLLAVLSSAIVVGGLPGPFQLILFGGVVLLAVFISRARQDE